MNAVEVAFKEADEARRVADEKQRAAEQLKQRAEESQKATKVLSVREDDGVKLGGAYVAAETCYVTADLGNGKELQGKTEITEWVPATDADKAFAKLLPSVHRLANAAAKAVYAKSLRVPIGSLPSVNQLRGWEKSIRAKSRVSAHSRDMLDIIHAARGKKKGSK